MRRDREGAALLELMLALAVAGFAMLGGVMLLDQLSDGEIRIIADRRVDAQTGNGDRVLRRVLADARFPSDTAERFRGDEHEASFPSLCDTSFGFAEPCRIRLAIDSLRDSTAILYYREGGERLELRRIAGAAVFRYLDLLSRDSTWVRRWEKSIALPAAIGVVRDGDTTVLPFGISR